MNTKKREIKRVLLLILVIISVMFLLPRIVFGSTEEIEVIVTKMHQFPYRDIFEFGVGQSLFYEVPSFPGWGFDYLVVDFGCEVKVTGDEVGDIFKIDDGIISQCSEG